MKSSQKAKFVGLGIYAGIIVLVVTAVAGRINTQNGNYDIVEAFILGAILAVIVTGIYLLPSIVAASNNKENFVAILVLNTVVAWTGLGYLICLIWSLKKDSQKQVVVQNFTNPPQAPPPLPAVEKSLEERLIELKSLRDKELLTEEEYTAKRAAILS